MLGRWPLSNIQMCVRSRIPTMWPSTTTESPARRSRITSSVVGKVRRWSAITQPRRAMPRGQTPGRVRSGQSDPDLQGKPVLSVQATVPRKAMSRGQTPGRVEKEQPPSGLPVVLDLAGGGDVRARAPGGPALVVDGDGVQGHVRIRVLDVALEDG